MKNLNKPWAVAPTLPVRKFFSVALLAAAVGTSPVNSLAAQDAPGLEAHVPNATEQADPSTANQPILPPAAAAAKKLLGNAAEIDANAGHLSREEAAKITEIEKKVEALREQMKAVYASRADAVRGKEELAKLSTCAADTIEQLRALLAVMESTQSDMVAVIEMAERLLKTAQAEGTAKSLREMIAGAAADDMLLQSYKLRARKLIEMLEGMIRAVEEGRNVLTLAIQYKRFHLVVRAIERAVEAAEAVTLAIEEFISDGVKAASKAASEAQEQAQEQADEQADSGEATEKK